jgi:integrase
MKQQEARDRRGRGFEGRLFRTRLLPRLGASLLVGHVTPALLARYEHERAAEVGRWTVRHELGLMGRALRMAHRLGVIDREVPVPTPPKGEHRTRFLSEDEITRLLAACSKSRNELLTPLVGLALTTGARYSELATLTWEQVDLGADFGLPPVMRLERTKSGKPRTLPLIPDAVEILAALQPDPAQRTGPVFRLDGSSIRKAFDKALERAGIPKGTDPSTRVSFHTLRHSSASWLGMRGAHLLTIQKVLGHATVAQTARYAHLGVAHIRADLERLAGLVTLPVANERAAAHAVAQLLGSES